MWFFGRRSTLSCPTLHLHLVSFVLLFPLRDFQSFTRPPFTQRHSPHASPSLLRFLPIFCFQCLEEKKNPPSLCFPGEWKCVKTWFDRGALVHGFQAAAHKVLQGKGLQGTKSYMQRQPAPQSSQTRETAPCNSSPAEVLAGSLGKLIDSKLLVENIRTEREEE